jgi:hypothetical protein
VATPTRTGVAVWSPLTKLGWRTAAPTTIGVAVWTPRRDQLVLTSGKVRHLFCQNIPTTRELDRFIEVFCVLRCLLMYLS